MNEIHAVKAPVTSVGEAAASVAEFRTGDEQIGERLFRGGQVVLRIDPRPDGKPWHVPARGLHEALATAHVPLGAK